MKEANNALDLIGHMRRDIETYKKDVIARLIRKAAEHIRSDKVPIEVREIKDGAEIVSEGEAESDVVLKRMLLFQGAFEKMKSDV